MFFPLLKFTNYDRTPSYLDKTLSTLTLTSRENLKLNFLDGNGPYSAVQPYRTLLLIITKRQETGKLLL